MPSKEEGEGSNSLMWHFDDEMPAFESDTTLVELFQNAEYKQGNKLMGTIGTGEIYSREADRIHWIHKEKNTLCEDMETYAVFQVCNRMQIPCVGVRVISNNELLHESFDRNAARILQKYIIKTLKSLEGEQKRGLLE